MFDIGFSEMLVIAVVALIVIGPARLPGVARTVGHLFGRMQRYVNDVKSDIQREIELDELRELRDSVESSAREIEQSVSREFQAVEQEMHELQALANPVEPEPEKKSKPSPVQGSDSVPLPAASEPGAHPERSSGAGAAGSAPGAEQQSSSAAAPQPAVPAAAAEQPKQA